VLAAIRAALARERRVYVHCPPGSANGLIIGCFLADEESSGKTVLKTLNRLWRQSERAATWPKVRRRPNKRLHSPLVEARKANRLGLDNDTLRANPSGDSSESI